MEPVCGGGELREDPEPQELESEWADHRFYEKSTGNWTTIRNKPAENLETIGWLGKCNTWIFPFLHSILTAYFPMRCIAWPSFDFYEA